MLGMVHGGFSDEGRVVVLPLDGPVASAKISPGDSAAVAYRMDFAAQKAICFQNISSIAVYIGSATVTSSDGYPLLSQGASLCADLKNGTTVYFYGASAGADVRAFATR